MFIEQTLIAEKINHPITVTAKQLHVVTQIIPTHELYFNYIYKTAVIYMYLLKIRSIRNVNISRSVNLRGGGRSLWLYDWEYIILCRSRIWIILLLSKKKIVKHLKVQPSILLYNNKICMNYELRTDICSCSWIYFVYLFLCIFLFKKYTKTLGNKII